MTGLNMLSFLCKWSAVLLWFVLRMFILAFILAVGLVRLPLFINRLMLLQRCIKVGCHHLRAQQRV